jgi:hypothetical protein
MNKVVEQLLVAVMVSLFTIYVARPLAKRLVGEL